MKTNAEVNSIVESEGLEYAITKYLDPDEIADEELRAMWSHARFYLEEIMNILDQEVSF